ncbi:MAG: SUMF1/EgtB/PvdO family nonheme iron enzyme [Desulfosalsimonas sp.]|uniref:formylglycine-generating enzyme family protein n=1 Tax=Desulfosalsimonas sp. TaxID=3073848 RepID=UPI003970C37E
MRNLYFLISLAAVFALLTLPPAVRAAEKVYKNRLGMEFVRIEPGLFMMGSLPDAPLRGESKKPHEAAVSEPFFMQTTEVTIGQWQAVMGKKWLFPRKGPKNLPVTGVSWHDAKDS